MRILLLSLAVGGVVAALRSFQRGRGIVVANEREPSYDQIALRAHFVGLERHARGEPDDPLTDWMEAEHLLLS